MSGFDWGHFAKNFLKGFAIQTAENIKQSTKEAREYERRQRDLAERNLSTISRRNAVATQVISLTNQLRSEGASAAQIQAAIAAGPKTVAEFAAKVATTKKTLGVKKLNPSEMETILAVPDDFTVVDTDIEDLVRNTYGLGYVNKGVTDKIPSLSLMDVITGRKAMDVADYRLDSQLMSEGYTAYDINRMAAKQDYESLAPGTFVTFGDVKFFSADDYEDAFNAMSGIVAGVKEGPVFEKLERDIQDLINATDDKVEEEGGQDKVNSLIAELKKEQDLLLEKSAEPYIKSLINQYGESFTVESGPTLLKSLGFSKEYIQKKFGVTDEQGEEPIGEEPIGEVSTTIRPRARPARIKNTGENIDEEGPEKKKANTEVEKAEVSTEEGVTKKIPFDTVDPNGVTYEEAIMMNSKERKQKGLPSSALGIQLYFEKYLTMEDEDVTVETTTSASDTAAQNEANKSALQNAMGNYTFAEWRNMSRSERKEKGLPERPLDVAFAGKDAFKEEQVTEADSIQDKFAKTYNITKDELDYLMDIGEIHLLDVQIGTQEDKEGNLLIDQLVDYVKDTGYDLSNASNISRAISEWSQKTNVRTPMNHNFLIKTIKQNI